MIFFRNRFFVLGGIVVIVGVIVIFFASLGYYPVLLVNGTPVSARRFFTNVQAASVYEQNLARTYPLGASSSSTTVEEDVLTGLVEEVLISQGLHVEAGNASRLLVEEKVARSPGDAEFSRMVKTLYGLEFDEFRESVLVPQATHDVLKGRIFLQGISFDEWLRDSRKKAHVIVLSSRFRWNGERVISK